MNEQDMTLARRLLTELYAAYYPAMYFKTLENMSVSGWDMGAFGGYGV